MNVIYVIGKVLTFPGAFMKAMWEHFVCRIVQLPIENAAYLNLDERCGHIEHSYSASRKKNLMLCLIPGLFNLFFGLPLFLTGFSAIIYFGELPGENVWLFVVHCVMLYLGTSLLCNLHPMTEDSMNCYELFYRGKPTNAAVRVLLFLPILCMRIGSFFERFALQLLCMLALLAAGYFLL